MENIVHNRFRQDVSSDKFPKKAHSSSKTEFWNDALFSFYYTNHYNNLNSKELDKEFSNDIKLLSKALSNLSDSDRKHLVLLLSKFIDFYINQKIEKELENYLNRILQKL